MSKQDVAWEELLWHGCSRLEDLEPLLTSTFRPYYSQRDKSINAYGRGCYFAMSSSLADQYACEAWSVEDGCPVRVLILAHVVVGDATLGSQGAMPPLKPNSSKPFDSFVDDEACPKLCVTTMDGQALQLYVVLYRRQWPSEGATVLPQVTHAHPHTLCTHPHMQRSSLSRACIVPRLYVLCNAMAFERAQAWLLLCPVLFLSPPMPRLVLSNPSTMCCVLGYALAGRGAWVWLAVHAPAAPACAPARAPARGLPCHPRPNP